MKIIQISINSHGKENFRIRIRISNVFRLFFPDTSSVDQIPPSPEEAPEEEEEESEAQEAEQGGVSDTITATSPSTETANNLAGLEVATESQSDSSMAAMQDTISEPASSACVTEERPETEETQS